MPDINTEHYQLQENRGSNRKGLFQGIKEKLQFGDRIPCGVATASSPDHGNQDVCTTKEFTRNGKRYRVVVVGDGSGGSFYGMPNPPDQPTQDKLIAGKAKAICDTTAHLISTGTDTDEAIVHADGQISFSKKQRDNPSQAALMAVIIDEEGNYEFAGKGDIAVVEWQEPPRFDNRDPSQWGKPDDPKRSSFQIKSIPDNQAQKAHLVEAHLHMPHSMPTGQLDNDPRANFIASSVGNGEQTKPKVYKGLLGKGQMLLVGTDGMRLASELIDPQDPVSFTYHQRADKIMRDTKYGSMDIQTAATRLVSLNQDQNKERPSQAMEADDMTLAIISRPHV